MRTPKSGVHLLLPAAHKILHVHILPTALGNVLKIYIATFQSFGAGTLMHSVERALLWPKWILHRKFACNRAKKPVRLVQQQQCRWLHFASWMRQGRLRLISKCQHYVTKNAPVEVAVSCYVLMNRLELDC